MTTPSCWKKRSQAALPTLALGLLMALAMACGLSQPTSTPNFLAAVMDPSAFVSPSLDEQIFRSGTIVRASLLSAAAGVETVPSGSGVAPTYRPVQELRFRIHEYLKGSGASESAVVVGGEHTYLTSAEARQAADAALAQRNTAWDGREGLLFLNTLSLTYTAAAPSGASGAAQPTDASVFTFTLSNQGAQPNWDYAVDTLSRAWLPATGPGGATGQVGSSTFITDGSQSPPPVISLADLRSKIKEFETTMNSGAGTAGFKDCVHRKIVLERHRRAVPWSPSQYQAHLTSGSASGTEVNRYTNSYREPEYNRFWLSGPDMNLFQALIVDDDSISSNGYDHTLATARPLPAGEYRVSYNEQGHRFFPCNFVPQDGYIDWTVTVTAPMGTVHEAFFDPAADGAAVGHSTTAGVLNPAGFTASGTATTIESLSWQDGSVTLALDPYVYLSGNFLDFIALDGSMALSLDVEAATADSGAGTLTWNVVAQPWHDSDKLMLRIRQVPTASLSPLPEVIPFGSSQTYTVSTNIPDGVMIDVTVAGRPTEACIRAGGAYSSGRYRNGDTLQIPGCDAGKTIVVFMRHDSETIHRYDIPIE